MSSLIKFREAGELPRVLPLSGVPSATKLAAARDPVAEEMERLHGELQALSATLAERDAEVRQLTAAKAQAFEEGTVAGRLIGLAEADTLRSEALNRLESGIGEALVQLSSDLQSMERLAVVLAQEGLERIVGPNPQRRELLELAIGHQVRQIETHAIVCIQVSRAEFPDPADLTALGQTIGRSSLDIQASDDLRAGDCLVKLRLGGLDIGLNQQWSALTAAMGRLAAPGDPHG